MRKTVIALTLLLLPLTAPAQETPKVELFGGYSYFRTEDDRNLHGWDGSVVVNLNKLTFTPGFQMRLDPAHLASLISTAAYITYGTGMSDRKQKLSACSDRWPSRSTQLRWPQ